MGMTATFTVFFEDPFWVGVVEIEESDGIHAARHVFGAEPSGPELHQFVLDGSYDALARQALEVAPASEHRSAPPAMNPKRAARLAARQADTPRPSTAAQQALQANWEQQRRQRRSAGAAEREAMAREQRQKAVSKAKARHRGR